ncbi:MAG: shikimate dehydrogenase [Alphaproteobacteria bacterium]|nr:shikimate dehydrogenase [Alphaproteobacteria bacterium]
MVRPVLRLGLIGDAIAASRAPELHRLAGGLLECPTDYVRLVPAEMGVNFDGAFAYARDSGFRGLNITYPYKARVVEKLRLDDPALRRLGAVNTVLFEPDGSARGENTDLTGFMAAFRARFGATKPGHVLLIGCGGVGRAVGFGLAALGADGLVLVDIDQTKAARLRQDLQADGAGGSIEIEAAATGAVGRVDGIVNCTPIGMEGGEPGVVLPTDAFRCALWAFDAVYTPSDTPFLRAARANGLATLSGYELFFHQGLHAVRLFHGRAVDAEALRRALARA